MLVNSCKVSLYRLTARQGQATFLALQVVPAREYLHEAYPLVSKGQEQGTLLDPCAPCLQA
eukprot:scaffold56452_cov16-Tisochrysis_lutea.AAC.1